MPRVSYYQAYEVSPSKVHAGFDVRRSLCHDDILGEIPELALRVAPILCRVAGVVCGKRPEVRGRLVDSRGIDLQSVSRL